MLAKLFGKFNEVGFPFAWGQNPDQSFQSDPFLLVKMFSSISFSGFFTEVCSYELKKMTG